MQPMSVCRKYSPGVLSGALSPASSLRRWLAGRWALLFSHPEDFASYGFEADRWLIYLQETFDSRRLRAVAVGPVNEASWVSDIGGRFILTYEAEELLPQLHDRAQDRGEHFVTIIDDSLCARRTLLYSPGNEVPSLIELVQTAARLYERAMPSVRRILQSI